MLGNLPAFAATGRVRSYSCRRRAGLTILEFTACTIALVGGAWLGALYLGVDVRHLAFSALNQAKLLDKMPPELRPYSGLMVLEIRLNS